MTIEIETNNTLEQDELEEILNIFWVSSRYFYTLPNKFRGIVLEVIGGWRKSCFKWEKVPGNPRCTNWDKNRYWRGSKWGREIRERCNGKISSNSIKERTPETRTTREYDLKRRRSGNVSTKEISDSESSLQWRSDCKWIFIGKEWPEGLWKIMLWDRIKYRTWWLE